GVSSAVFSNDEQFILTTGLDNTARIWDAVTQKQKGPDMKHAGGVNSVVLSRKNELALTAGNDDDVKIWNLLSTDSIPLKAVPRTLSLPAGWEPVDGVGRAVFSPNENQILGAVGVYSKDRSLAFDTAFFLQNLASGQSATQISTNSKFARHVSFSPDGKQLLTLESDGVAFVRNGVTGSLVNPALKHEGSILSALFSPDGKDILTESPGGSGSYRGSVVRIWNAAKEKAKNDFITLNGRVESIRTAVFSPDSKKILTISFQTSGQLWDAATGTTKGPSLEHKSQIMSAVFSADNKYLLTTGFDSIARVWYAETGLPVGKPFNHNGGLAAAVFGKNNRQIITVTLDGKVYSGDIDTGALVEYPSTGKPPLKTGIAGAIGQQLLLPGIRLTDHLSEVIFGKELADTIKKKAFLLRKFYFNPNGNQAAILRTPTSLYILSISNQNESGKVIEHDKRINTVSFSPGGKSVLTTSDDGTARLWDCRTGRQIGPSMIHKGAVIAAAFSPDGKRIVTAGTDNAA
ncbi:MAG TPA: hypothetical protein VEY06_13160, partial [Flavisolibacter sp.]|nr:hypothetical protein [Flavisolibacter sp.]